MLVLRFRDLGIEPGQTINRHRKVIAAHDACWWGWWARRHEDDPSQWLDAIPLPTTICLFDSDALSIYRANCFALRCSTSERLSPVVEQTPDYYNSRRLRAWFRFSDIDDGSPDDVIDSWCRASTVAAAVGTRIQSLDDLQGSPATMWLLERE